MLRRALTIVPITLALAVGGTLASAVAASAATPQTKTVTWSVPGGLGDRFSKPQVLAANASGCGDFQVDVYRYDTDEARAFVDNLIAQGTISSAAADGPVFISNTDVSNVCDTSGRVIGTSGSGSVGTAPGSGSGTTTTVGSTTTGSTSTSNDGAATAAVATGTSGVADPSGSVLAFTGSDDVVMNMLAAAGVVAIAGGLVVFGIRRFVVDGK